MVYVQCLGHINKLICKIVVSPYLATLKDVKELPRVDRTRNPVGDDKIKTLVTWWFKYFYNIVSEFYENIYFSNWQPYIAEKNWDKWMNFTLYPTENGFFLNSVPRDTGFPLKDDYTFIKEVDPPDGISYHGGGRCHTRLFGTWGKGGWRWQDIKMLNFWLIYAQY